MYVIDSDLITIERVDRAPPVTNRHGHRESDSSSIAEPWINVLSLAVGLIALSPLGPFMISKCRERLDRVQGIANCCETITVLGVVILLPR